MKNLSVMDQKVIFGGSYWVVVMEYQRVKYRYSFDTEEEANRYVSQVNDDPYYGINSGNWDGIYAYLRGEY